MDISPAGTGRDANGVIQNIGSLGQEISRPGRLPHLSTVSLSPSPLSCHLEGHGEGLLDGCVDCSVHGYEEAQEKTA